jgi:hypothetical protein
MNSCALTRWRRPCRRRQPVPVRGHEPRPRSWRWESSNKGELGALPAGMSGKKLPTNGRETGGANHNGTRAARLRRRPSWAARTRHQWITCRVIAPSILSPPPVSPRTRIRGRSTVNVSSTTRTLPRLFSSCSSIGVCGFGWHRRCTSNATLSPCSRETRRGKSSSLNWATIKTSVCSRTILSINWKRATVRSTNGWWRSHQRTCGRVSGTSWTGVTLTTPDLIPAREAMTFMDEQRSRESRGAGPKPFTDTRVHLVHISNVETAGGYSPGAPIATSWTLPQLPRAASLRLASHSQASRRV